MKFKYFAFYITLLLIVSCSEDPVDDFGSGTITGTVVTDGDNIPLENVKISSNPVSNTVFTNSEGEFIITDVPAGQYSVQAELDGYNTAFEASQVVDGKVNNIVFELEVSTLNNSGPLAPDLIAPADQSTNLPTEVSFLWTSGSNDDDVLEYVLELRNVTQNTIERYEEIADTTYTVSNLMKGSSYVWQVVVSDGINASVRSDNSQFKTAGYAAKDFHFVRKVNNNSVIFSSDEAATEQINLTSFDQNSFRPRKNSEISKIAFLQTVAGNTQL